MSWRAAASVAFQDGFEALVKVLDQVTSERLWGLRIFVSVLCQVTSDCYQHVTWRLALSDNYFEFHCLHNAESIKVTGQLPLWGNCSNLFHWSSKSSTTSRMNRKVTKSSFSSDIFPHSLTVTCLTNIYVASNNLDKYSFLSCSFKNIKSCEKDYQWQKYWRNLDD